MHYANKKTLFGDYVFEVCENVYEPAEDSFLFAENLQVSLDMRVLDVGTGIGILGILAARNADKVFALDINPYAIRCAKRNAALNKVDGNMSFMQGDLFSPIAKDAKFSLILFNAPYLPSKKVEPESWLERAWAGGKTGRVVIDRFIFQAAEHLEETGEILLMQSNLANVEKTFGEFHAVGMKTETVARLNLPFFETLFLIKATFTDA